MLLYLVLQMVSLGGFILIFGFLACNAGSQGAISRKGDGSTVALAIVNTILSDNLFAHKAQITVFVDVKEALNIKLRQS